MSLGLRAGSSNINKIIIGRTLKLGERVTYLRTHTATRWFCAAREQNMITRRKSRDVYEIVHTPRRCFPGHVREHAAPFGHRATGHIMELRVGPSRVRREDLHQKLHGHLSVGHRGLAVTHTGPHDQRLLEDFVRVVDRHQRYVMIIILSHNISHSVLHVGQGIVATSFIHTTGKFQNKHTPYMYSNKREKI